MAAKSEAEYLDDLISCPVCLENYTDPRLLKCGHQFCMSCLKSISKTTAKGKKNISCPICRKMTHLEKKQTIEKLPKPIVAYQLQEALTELVNLREKKGAYICEHCDKSDSKAVHYCFACQDSMCEYCYNVHQTVPELTTHYTCPITSKVFCDIHKKLITKCCADCQSLVCGVCIRKIHNKHTIIDISASNQADNDLTIEKVKVFISHLQIHEDVDENVKSKIKEFCADIDNDIKDMIKIQMDLKNISAKAKNTESKIVDLFLKGVKVHMDEAGLQIKCDDGSPNAIIFNPTDSGNKMIK